MESCRGGCVFRWTKLWYASTLNLWWEFLFLSFSRFYQTWGSFMIPSVLLSPKAAQVYQNKYHKMHWHPIFTIGKEKKVYKGIVPCFQHSVQLFFFFLIWQEEDVIRSLSVLPWMLRGTGQYKARAETLIWTKLYHHKDTTSPAEVSQS